eukprot:1282705-Rhodomonas_salina.1
MLVLVLVVVVVVVCVCVVAVVGGGGGVAVVCSGVLRERVVCEQAHDEGNRELMTGAGAGRLRRYLRQRT